MPEENGFVDYLNFQGITCENCSKYCGGIPDHRLCYSFEVSDRSRENIGEMRTEYEQMTEKIEKIKQERKEKSQKT